MSVSQIPIDECGEPLVDVRSLGGLLMGPPPEHPDTELDYGWVRRSVYEKLIAVQRSLPPELRLRLYEGLRSLSMQHRLFEEEKARVAHDEPHLSARQVHERASLLIAPPVHWDGSRNIPPHSTGAAVDVELVGPDGRVIDFGMEAKDWVSVPAEYCETLNTEVSATARDNRLLLCRAMEAQGFVNYVREWWHYSYGDRYWALMTGQPKAIYGPVERPANA